MCGIICVTGKKLDKIRDKSVNEMLVSLSRRGPDDCGILKFHGCVLGQTRLSIIDISGGHQPMKDNEKNIAITFNGEIYNYKELRKKLENKGHKFSTNSDTEVILKSYIEHGHKCLDYFDGMFAFAIWDEEKQSLFMARDRFGKKPLYYAFDNDGNLMFASEIKALFASGQIIGELDCGAIDNYLTLMYVPSHKTVYKNIFTLRPAHFAVLENGKLNISCYWELLREPEKITYGEAKERIRELFRQAVEKRLIADVEVGSFLSGGVDSTLVTAYAQAAMNRPLKTFSLGYGNYINELPYAEEASKKIGTDHYTLQTTNDLAQELKKVIEYMDEPHADSSNFPQHLISALASTKVKVALSGDGADELFMGYGWYQKHWHLPFRERLKQQFFSDPFKGYLKNISIFSIEERKKIWQDKTCLNADIFTKEPSISADPITKINDFDIATYLPGQLLSKIDSMGMMHSLEVRSPFLDHKLVEFVYGLPTEYKMNKHENKIILKDILSEIMPKKFVYRRKQGFGAPIAQWLKAKEFETLARETVGNTQSRMYSFLNSSYPQELMMEFYNGKNEKAAYKLWSLLCFELWLRNHAPFIKFS
ncbi:asparagine synthase (glutamine-hydrolyzing) [Patescibacteria group bacterium]|nr:asparagine synthase (glutamine-hydrolyzing) [Patescibacteria group bacterium]